jgi:hypothetical protein
MAKVTLKNNRLGDLIVGDVIVPRDGGTAEIDSDSLKEQKKNPAVEAWFDDGWLVEVKAQRGERSSGSNSGSGTPGGSGGSGSGSGSNSGSGSGSGT